MDISGLYTPLIHSCGEVYTVCHCTSVSVQSFLQSKVYQELVGVTSLVFVTSEQAAQACDKQFHYHITANTMNTLFLKNVFRLNSKKKTSTFSFRTITLVNKDSA